MKSPGQRRVLAAFVVSGVSGLAYEVVWTRYLALWVGREAVAQVLVLSLYMGGMGLGALAIGGVSRRLRRPLRAYAAAEGALALFGVLFHPAFTRLSAFSLDTLFPALGNAPLVAAVRWGLAVLLVLPPAMVLGTTFPLMAAGLVRRDRDHPGLGVAVAYLLNTLGGAAGVLIAGFLWVPRFGLPGALVAAAAGNAGAALLAFQGDRADGGGRAEEEAPAGDGVGRPGTSATPDRRLIGLFLGVAFGTAAASFTYEIAWTRMLALAMGSATHAFELMLSACIVGLALGSGLVRRLVDETPVPLRVLGYVQAAMGAAALATMPVYPWIFHAVAALVRSLPGRGGAYLIFNLSRYALALVLMLPATLLAGMTLPLITGTLVRRGAGEGAIGRVYGANTLGAVLGAIVSGLVLLPFLGMRRLLLSGAALDMVLGVWVLASAVGRERLRRTLPVLVGGGALVALAGAAFWVPWDPVLLTGGVFRYGAVPAPGSRKVLYYHDGRTATVGIHYLNGEDVAVLTTNGKPDASLGGRWFRPGRLESQTPLDAGSDAATQVIAPLIALAYRPDARNVVNIGHGSGVSGSMLLSGAEVRRLVTVEIEPDMVAASRAFLPVNRRVFDDPRSTFVIDDARAYFAYAGKRFDLIFSEPSNPWVAGAASLFTLEFYGEVRQHLAAGGVFAQWIQLYEISDDLVLSVMRALDQSFPSYEVYVVGDEDILLIARADGPLPAPDWGVLDLPGVDKFLSPVPPLRAQHLQALRAFDETTLRPLLKGVAANSDYRPRVESDAELDRFLHRTARGILSLATIGIDLPRTLAGERMVPPDSFVLPPARGLAPAVERGLSTWLQEALVAGGGLPPPGYPEWRGSLFNLRDLLTSCPLGSPPTAWQRWTRLFSRVELDLHLRTSGWVDTTFYKEVGSCVGASGVPPEARAAVHLMHGVRSWDFTEAAAAADVLVGPVAAGQPWIPAAELLDGAVLAYLKVGRPSDARRAFKLLVGRSRRPAGNARNALLDALIRQSGA